MWQFKNEDGYKKCSYSKESQGNIYLIIGCSLMIASFALYFFGSEINAALGDSLPWQIRELSKLVGTDIPIIVLGLVGALILIIGFIFSGTETQICFDQERRLLTLDMSYGFGSCHKELALDDVLGLKFTKINVDIYRHMGTGLNTLGGERRVDGRIDGRLELVTRSEGVIPLVTDGPGAQLKQDGRQMSEFLGIELKELAESKKEYTYHRV